MFYLIEYRGCNIEYIAKVGTEKQCNSEMNKLLKMQAKEVHLPSWEKSLHNGNGYAFTYEIVASDELEIREAERYASVPFDPNEILED